ncbi:MAG: glycosyltransferase family 2 protein [Sphingomonadales bacterium]|nr:glycosyltransferase family 2 protein [Sphingomonadales bacterium]
MREGAVTIGMPVYNGATYLPESIAALRAQSSPYIARILVSDNCSTDATPTLLADWAASDPRVTVVRQATNIGAMPNFKYLIRQADTEFFMFAAHDDLWSPDYVTALHRALVAKPTAPIAIPTIRQVSADLAREIVSGFPAAEIGGRPTPSERGAAGLAGGQERLVLRPSSHRSVSAGAARRHVRSCLGPRFRYAAAPAAGGRRRDRRRRGLHSASGVEFALYH